MKQGYFLLLIITIIPIFGFSQASINIGGPNSAEIGQPYNFNFSIEPNYLVASDVDYRVTQWTVSVQNINAGYIPGLLEGET
ncbi:hypothetical protein [Mesonia sp.]|uniref:hypothetical protein n=1 Tax=Mesonia sp. TaxID=1960830 RepID=UPI000C94ACFF|nr:hypothetical protein [Mesonia sp.]MAN25818.1 hypothetical protein [Mesonia sp.]|tara:strand:- start:6003 stop:6248 length:246 start_codon:yes stop_codon:yes gene_type:complete